MENSIKIKTTNSGSFHQFGSEEREEYEKQVISLKGEMEVMADKYEALNEYSAKLEKN